MDRMVSLIPAYVGKLLAGVSDHDAALGRELPTGCVYLPFDVSIRIAATVPFIDVRQVGLIVVN